MAAAAEAAAPWRQESACRGPSFWPRKGGKEPGERGRRLRALTCVAGPSSRLILIFKKQNPHNKQTVHKYSLNVLLPRVLCASQIHILFQLLKFFLS